MKMRRIILLGLSGLVSVALLLLSRANSVSRLVSDGQVVPKVATREGGASPALLVGIHDPASPAIPVNSPALSGLRQGGIGDRIRAVHALSQNLSHEEIAELYAYLKALPDTQEDKPPGLHVLKNDILNALREQATPAEGLTDFMIRLYHDRAQDNVTRDYALQHLVAWCEKGAPDSPDGKTRIHQVLLEAVAEKTAIAGTALLGLHRLSANEAAINDVVGAFALDSVLSADTAGATRITAVQVCAERKVDGALPKIEKLAQTPGDIALQISAIAALGNLGGPQQAVLLRRLKAEGNEPLGPAIEAALWRLDQKLELSLPNSNFP